MGANKAATKERSPIRDLAIAAGLIGAIVLTASLVSEILIPD